MTTVTAYGISRDGYLLGADNTVYSAAREGTTTVGYNLAALIAGQYGAGSYACYESFIAFDTSSIPDGATITQVELSLYLTDDKSDTDFTVQVRPKTWTGSGLTPADWVAGADIDALTLLATLNSSGIGATGAYKTFAENGSNFRAAINKTGNTELILTSSRHAAGNTPTGYEYLVFQDADNAGTDQDPKLVVTYTENTNYTQSTSGTTGSLSGVLSAGHVYTQAIAGAISSMTSALTRVINKATSGNFSATGATSKFTTKTFAGVSGTLSGSMTYVRVILHQISGTMGSLSGTVSDLQTGFGVNLTGAVGSMSGSISRSIGKSVSGTLTATGKVFKMNTFRSAIIKAGTVIRKVIQGGRDF